MCYVWMFQPQPHRFLFIIFSFPLKDVKVCKIWKDRCRRKFPADTNFRNLRICSDHFDGSAIIKGRLRCLLKRGSLPNAVAVSAPKVKDIQNASSEQQIIDLRQKVRFLQTKLKASQRQNFFLKNRLLQ